MDNRSKTFETPFFWQDRAWQGAFWKVFSCASFAGINTIVRYLGGGGSLGPESALPVSVMVFFQNVLGFILILPLFYHKQFKAFPLSPFSPIRWKTAYPKLHFFRVLTAVLGIIFLYLALQKMSIAESVALSFTGPIFTILGARIFLNESLNLQRALAILLSIIGAFIITRPDIVLLKSEGMTELYVLLPLLSAAALALSKLLTRQLAKAGETAEQLTLFLLLGMIPVSLIPALFEWSTPAASHWPWLVLLGLCAVLAHVSFGKAYALAEVTFLMPFGFSKFLFSMLLGYYCFVEIPSLSLWLGMGVIGLSLCCLAYKIPLYSLAKRFKSN
jgi:drug/metabolite transporter (DMT)-like permease